MRNRETELKKKPRIQNKNIKKIMNVPNKPNIKCAISMILMMRL